MAKEAPSRGEGTGPDDAGSPPALSRAITYQEYQANITKRMISVENADRFRWECMQQPNYRRDMQFDEDYYDGNQFTADVLVDLEDRGIPPIVTNLIGPTVDVVLGMELKTRRDFVVRPESDPKWDDVAQAMSERVKTAERLSMADHACSEAFSRTVKSGLGWVGVFRETNPHLYRYRCEHVNWKEMDYDPHSEDKGLREARFVRRSKFYDRDYLEAIFSDCAQEIHELGPGWRDGGSSWTSSREFFEAPMLRGASHGPWRDYSQTELNYIDWDRNRLQLEEIWYRVWVRGEVLDLPDLTSVVFDQRNQAHAYMAETGRASVRTGVWSEMRLSYFIGPLCVADVPSPMPHKDFPYVPFWGMREGRTGVPYGLIRRMRPMQDEVNARSSKMMWALSARRVITDADAVVDHDTTRLEVARPDAYIVLNPNRKANSKLEIDDNQGISDQQYKILQDRIQRLQDVGGVYQAVLGKESAADSGVAIANLVEQSTTTLAPINENFVFSRSQVGDRLLAFVIADMAQMRNVPVQVNSAATGKRIITINQTVQHEQTGLIIIENNVEKARLKVVLDDMPASATFRQQQFMRIADMVGQMAKFNPQLSAKFMDLLVEASDVPNKSEFVDRIRKEIGLQPDPSTMTAEQRAQFEQQQQQAQQQQEIQLRGILAKIGLDEAKIKEIQSKAGNIDMQSHSIQIGFDKIIAEIHNIVLKTEKTAVEIEAIKQDMADQRRALAAGLPAKQQVDYRW